MLKDVTILCCVVSLRVYQERGAAPKEAACVNEQDRKLQGQVNTISAS
jgi:hypothetical protein